MGAGVSTHTHAHAQAQERTCSIIHAASAPRCLQHPAWLCLRPTPDRVPTVACTLRHAAATPCARPSRKLSPSPTPARPRHSSRGTAHLPGLSTHYSMLHGSPITLKSLKDPGNRPCPFLPPSFPLRHGTVVAGRGALPGTSQGGGALSWWCQHPCHRPMPGPSWRGSTWVGEMHWVGKRSRYLFVILYLCFTSAGKWEAALGGAGRWIVPIHSRLWGIPRRAGSHR